VTAGVCGSWSGPMWIKTVNGKANGESAATRDACRGR
jgi:hypothetical protein